MIRIIDIYTGSWPKASVTIKYLYGNNHVVTHDHYNITHSSLGRVRNIAFSMYEVAGGEDGSTSIKELPPVRHVDYPKIARTNKRVRMGNGELPF